MARKRAEAPNAGGEMDDSAAFITEEDRDVQRRADEIAALQEQARKDGRAPLDDELNDEGIQDDELRSLSELDSAGDVRWIITCTAPPDKTGYVGELVSGELSLQKIAQLWGPGRYRVKGLRDNGQFFRQRTVTVSKASIPASAPTSAPQSSNVQDLLAILAADKRQQQESMMKWAAILAPIMGPVLLKLFDRGGTSLADLTTALKNMKELSGDKPPPDSLAQLTQVQKLIEVVRDMQPEPSQAGSTWVDLIRDAVQTVGPGLAAGLASKAGAPAAQPARPVAPPPTPRALLPGAAGAVNVPNPPTAAPVHANPEAANPMMALLHWFQEQLPGLEIRAAQDRDPAVYAQVLLDTVPENVDVREIQGILKRRDWWQLLSNFRPSIAPYQEWFKELHGELMVAISDMIREAQAPPAQQPVQQSETDLQRMTELAANAGEGEV
jgi:hypothetical protein